MASDAFVHPAALNESDEVGGGTRIWAFAHVMKGAVVGRDCNIGDHAFVESGAVIGDGVTVKNAVCVWEGVTVERYAFLGPGVMFTNDLRPRSPRGPAARTRYADKKNWLVPTLVREGASLGARSTIVCGVTIGRYALVAAGAVVTRDVPDFTCVAGSPARPRGCVCMCGARLEDHASPRCAACGRAYSKTGSGLRLEGSD